MDLFSEIQKSPGTRPIRVLMGKVGLDGHDRGAKVVMSALRDAGMEVIYTGLHQSPELLARAAVEEDVDLIGVSILSGAHGTLIPRVLQELKKLGRENVPIHVGGIIPERDIPDLIKKGVARVFVPGTPLDQIVEAIKADVAGGTKKPTCAKKKKPARKTKKKVQSRKRAK